MDLGIKPFDIAEYLTSSEAVTEYLNQVFADGDSAEISRALKDVARAKGGVEEIAKRAGVPVEQLAKDIMDLGKADFPTTVTTLRLLGVRLMAADYLIAA